MLVAWIMLERNALDLFLDLAILELAFEGNELPLMEDTGELRECSRRGRGAIGCRSRTRLCRSSGVNLRTNVTTLVRKFGFCARLLLRSNADLL